MEFIPIAQSLDAKDRRITALEAELKQSREYIMGMREQMVSDLDDLKREWRDRAESAEAERDRLREQLIEAGTFMPEGNEAEGRMWAGKEIKERGMQLKVAVNTLLERVEQCGDTTTMLKAALAAAKGE